MTGQKAKPKHKSAKPSHSLTKATSGVTPNSHQTFLERSAPHETQ
ncbi:hypothetical protein Thiowin_02092 [Thiorhodovibrio winogradskyi]|uniref:Uncharacterized protein n=1 Tax=Thiorhodovibrio winogradskyi TaxID=77007 RepID=A0ABZ0S9C4_9GAMM